jgi:hypothetical protein
MNGRSRREYLAVIYARYRRAGLQEKQLILSEFCRNTGYNRKYAIRLLNGPWPDPRREGPPRSTREGRFRSTQFDSSLNQDQSGTARIPDLSSAPMWGGQGRY